MSKAAELAKIGEVATNSQIGGRRNLVINGAMQISQRATSATGVGGTNEEYPAIDRFNFTTTSAGRFTMTQTADGPSGFANCIKLDCTTADTSLAATERLTLLQVFEGQDVQQLKKGTSDAESVTVSFYVKGDQAATYVCELSDGDNSRMNGQAFSVTTDWNRIELTFAGDTTGAFDDDNAASLFLGIWLHAGSNFTSGTFASNTWTSITNANRYAGSKTSFFDSTDREFFLTGVQMEIGSQATNFEHRSVGEELALCQRYYHEMQVKGMNTAAGSTQTYMACFQPFATTMRAAPTTTSADVNDATANKVNIWGSGNVGFASLQADTNSIKYIQLSSGIDTTNILLGDMTFDAEL